MDISVWSSAAGSPYLHIFWWRWWRGLLSCPYHTTTRPRAYKELDGEKHLEARLRGRVLVAECRWLMWGQLRCLDIIKWHRHSTRLKYDYPTVTTQSQSSISRRGSVVKQINKKKPATALDFKYHGVTVTAVCFLTFAEKVFSVCCSASFQHVVTTRKRSCSPLNEISDSNRVDTIKSTFFFPGSEAWPYSHPPPLQKSTPPHLLYSQLAYGDETVCVGGGTDEVGGPLCVSASVCVRAIGSVCVGGGLRSRSLERRDRGRLFQPAVSSRHRTAHCQPN